MAIRNAVYSPLDGERNGLNGKLHFERNRKDICITPCVRLKGVRSYLQAVDSGSRRPILPGRAFFVFKADRYLPVRDRI